MRSFAIEEPGSPVSALYATLLKYEVAQFYCLGSNYGSYTTGSQGVVAIFTGSGVVVRIIDNFARRLYNMNIKEQVE